MPAALTTSQRIVVTDALLPTDLTAAGRAAFGAGGVRSVTMRGTKPA